MPELPEVEHARRILARWMTGARIITARVEDARILDEGARAAKVAAALAGRRVVTVERRGKWLRLVLDRGYVFSHLGMTGKWVRAAADAPAVRFEKVRIDLGARTRASASVRYLDPRLFGRFVVSEEDLPAWNELGPDPLVDGIDTGVLHAALARRKLPVKATLLDQTVLAGVGNIQATEALFLARIDPRRPARDLSRRETAALASGIRRTIAKTLAMQGDGEAITYVEEPGAENPFLIYGRGGEACPRCKRPLTKIVLAGRGTVYCSACQM